MAKTGSSVKGSKDESKSKLKTGNIKTKGVNFYHDKATATRLRMRSGGKAVRDSRGKVIKAAFLQDKSAPTARIQPDRRWFGNTRVVGQADLETFRKELGGQKNDPYRVLLKQAKIPMGLLETENQATKRMHVLESESFSYVFGKQSQRRRPKLQIGSISELAQMATEKLVADDEKLNAEGALEFEMKDAVKDPLLHKGQSRRIWNELYKVIDSSDVVVHVLDARDPLGTRCRAMEAFMAKEAPHKHLILLLNKSDLLPPSVLTKWVKHLSREKPTLAFHASMRNPFGRGTLVQLLRQYGRLHKDKRQISVGFVGYPNVGKSSVINALRAKAVCPTAPVPGHTRVWQYVSLTRKISLIDCPGVVPTGMNDTDSETVLKGVVRVEALDAPEEYIPALLAKVEVIHVSRTYDLWGWTSSEDFLTRLALKAGRLLKGGEPDLGTAARMVLQDWLRGKIPYYTLPPGAEKENSTENLDENQSTNENIEMSEDLTESLNAESVSAEIARIKGQLVTDETLESDDESPIN